MRRCSVEREVIGSTAWFHVGGRFDGASAWEMASCIQSEPLGDLALDFSQCGEFADYGIAVLANALQSVPGKRVQFVSLRQHQERLFKYFGVDVGDRTELPHDAQSEPPPPAREVA